MRDGTRTRKTLPVDLLLEGRRCLVVGGGPIAARKVGHLVEAGAKVTVVAGTACPELLDRARSTPVRYVARDFRPGDVKGAFLVFAATNDGAANRRVLAECRRRGVLCSAADANWPRGDFLTPAILRRAELTLTVATGGQSCRRARLVKDLLARRLDQVATADLAVFGVAGTVRPATLAVVGGLLRQVWGLHEFAPVAGADTCRLLAVIARERPAERLVRCILRAGAGLSSRVSVTRGPAAIACLARLWVCDRDRVGRALARARRAGWAGTVLAEWEMAAWQVAEGMDASGRARRSASAGAAPTAKACQERYEQMVRAYQGGHAVE